MELIVRHEGRERDVFIEAVSGGYVVTVDGRRYEVDVVSVGRTVRSLLIDGRQAEVGLRKRGRNRYEVLGRNGCEVMEVMEPLTLLAEKTHDAQAGSAVSQVAAYMPGRVVQLLVSEGEQVVAGQGILVLQAMKMENEIQAEHDGTVERFFVTPGQAVEGGDPLYELGRRS